MNATLSRLTHGRHLVKNVGWSLAGQIIPMLAALVAVPLLVKGLGIDRFGVLSLVLVVIGYFSMFDMGIGRALTQRVAARLGREEYDELGASIASGLLLLLVLGVLSGLLLFAASAPLVDRVLELPVALREETRATLVLLAFALPVVMLSNGLRGLLEAHQEFRAITFVRAPVGTLTFLAPLLALSIDPSLVGVTLSIVLVRIGGMIAFAALALGQYRRWLSGLTLDFEETRAFFKIGGWMTISNVISPIMVNIDRFVLGAVLSIAAVAYYSAPFDVVTRLLFLPAGIMGVMFPALSSSLAGDPAKAGRLFYRTITVIALAMLFVCTVGVLFAEPGLRLWLGADFAAESARVAQILFVGIFLNSLGQVPYGLLQAAGRADIPAKLHLIELPLYLVVLWGLVDRYGIDGAAMAWALRVGLDAAILLIIGRRMLAATQH